MNEFCFIWLCPSSHVSTLACAIFSRRNFYHHWVFCSGEAKMITPAAEARRSGPIADYIALSRALDALIWQGIYNRSNTASIPDACAACNFVPEDVESTPWLFQLISELEALGYEVSAEGLVSW